MKINIFVQSLFHRSLTFYNLIYNEALLTPSTHKNFMQNVEVLSFLLWNTLNKWVNAIENK